jgi:hypothetical protein
MFRSGQHVALHVGAFGLREFSADIVIDQIEFLGAQPLGHPILHEDGLFHPGHLLGWQVPEQQLP